MKKIIEKISKVFFAVIAIIVTVPGKIFATMDTVKSSLIQPMYGIPQPSTKSIIIIFAIPIMILGGVAIAIKKSHISKKEKIIQGSILFIILIFIILFYIWLYYSIRAILEIEKFL